MFLSGGLAEEVDEKVLHAAFIPFGDITDIQIPLDYETGKIRSFSITFDVNCAVSMQHQTLRVRSILSYINVSCVLFSEKHRGFAFIEFELAEVCTRYNAEIHTIDINPIKTKL